MAPLRASLARSPPRLGRSQAGGLHPRPPGLRPLARLRAPGPCCLGHPAGGFRAQVRPVAGVVNRLRLSTLDAQPLAVFGLREKFKGGPCVCTAGGFGGVPPLIGDGGQPGPGGGRPGCSRRLCPPSTDWARLSTGDQVQRRSGRGCLAVSPEDKNQSAWPES